VTLGDDGNKVHVKIEQLGGQAVEQVEQLAFASNAERIMRGNVSGDCIFTAGKSHADRGTALAYFKTNFGYIGQTGSLVITVDATTITMANATLRSVTAVEINGVRWMLRYTFGITTVA